MNQSKKNLLETLIENVTTFVPERVNELHNDIKDQMRTALTKLLNECHIVTQEEFESYAKALKRAQKRIHVLEEKLAQLMSKSDQ